MSKQFPSNILKKRKIVSIIVTVYHYCAIMKLIDFSEHTGVTTESFLFLHLKWFLFKIFTICLIKYFLLHWINDGNIHLKEYLGFLLKIFLFSLKKWLKNLTQTRKRIFSKIFFKKYNLYKVTLSYVSEYVSRVWN